MEFLFKYIKVVSCASIFSMIFDFFSILMTNFWIFYITFVLIYNMQDELGVILRIVTIPFFIFEIIFSYNIGYH